MARIALKVDVDTWRGTREGVPNLVALLQKMRAGATFLFSLGPDHTGRAIFRALRPGFLSKVSRTSVVEHYGVRTLLYGSLLPGPDIGRREATTMRAVRNAGFETGVHCWDHVRWQDRLLARDAAWALQEMRRATDRFAEIFGTAARCHGAAGWQFNEAAARAEASLGILVASDTRGTHAFLPVDATGAAIGPAQFPTTLPTLDELIGTRPPTAGGAGSGSDVEITADNVHRHLLSLTERSTQDHVYTLHAELEGLRLQPVLERLIAGWRAQGHEVIAMAALHEGRDLSALPKHRIAQGEVPGRSGVLAVQGAAFGAG